MAINLTGEIIIGITVIAISIVGYVWTFSSLMTKLKLKPNLSDIERVVKDEIKAYPTKEQVTAMIDKKIDNHCPYSDSIAELQTVAKTRVDLLNNLKLDVQKLGDDLKIDIKEIKINLQNVCEKVQVTYKK